MRPVVFLGTDDVAARCLRELAAADLVSLVVTPPERPRGRRRTPVPCPAGEQAAALGLPVLPTADVNREEDLVRIRGAAPRVLAVVSFGQILRDPLLRLAPGGPLNLHFSLLPRWRGAAPVQRAILAGDEATGVCVQRMVAALDAGAVLAQERIPLGPRDATPGLRERLAELGAPLLRRVVEEILEGRPPPAREQDPARVTVARRVRREEGDLDFAAESAVELDRRIRALQPWPGCRAVLHGAAGDPVDLLIREASPEERPAPAGAPGEVLDAGPGGILVAAREGALRVTRLQRAGGREVDAAAFLNGTPVRPGDRMASPAS